MSIGFSDDLAGLTDEAFLRTAYVTLLGRAADAAGTRDYLARLKSGVGRKQVWAEISTSEEAQRHLTRRAPATHSVAPASGTVQAVGDLLRLEGAAFIAEAYRQVLGRDVDATGARNYGSRLAAGDSKEQILADLRSDPEGQAFNSRLAGLDDLVRAVQAGKGGAAGSLDELLALDGPAFVKGAYQLLFRREADDGGLARYCPLLRQGFSKLFVLDALYTSPEARDKGASLPSLEPRLRAYRRAQRTSWSGWYWRHVRGVESDLPRDREVRALFANLRAQ